MVFKSEQTMKNNIAVFTIASKNYISFARVLMSSIRQFHADVDLHLLLADEIDGAFDKTREEFQITEAREIPIPHFKFMAFTYNILEFNTAVKPFFIKMLFERGYNKVIYFDSDILVVNKLDELFSLLDSYSLVVTPHMTLPLPDGDQLIPSEQQLLLGGTYNLGFITLSKSTETSTFYEWWCKKCYSACYDELESGLFVDQKWINLVPGFFESVCILRKKGYNMAYWNLHERTLSGLIVNGTEPLIFYHFSGIDPNNLNPISKHQNRYRLETRKDLVVIYEKYRDLLLTNAYDETRHLRYKYDRYDNGVIIGQAARRLYSLVVDKFQDPFQVGPGTFYELLRNKHLLEHESDHPVHGIAGKARDKQTAKTVLNLLFKTLKLFLGARNYYSLLAYLRGNASLRKQDFLIR
jgi:lipopolysaccharide biosynthesis glycosyltransferase